MYLYSGVPLSLSLFSPRVSMTKDSFISFLFYFEKMFYNKRKFKAPRNNTKVKDVGFIYTFYM